MLAVAWGLLASGPATAGQQQASFSVAVTLHRLVKPLSAAELCKDGKPIQTLGATIQVDCPRPVERAGADAQGARANEKIPRPEVTVIF